MSGKTGKIILSLCELAIGVILLINPIGFTSGVIVAVGAALVVVGIISIVKYFRADPDIALADHGLARGLIELAAGAFCVINSHWFIATFPLLTILYGIVTLVTGITKLQWTVDMIRLKMNRWFIMGIAALLTVTCALIMLFNPFGSTAVLWTFIAITLIVEAVIDVVAAFMGNSSGERKFSTKGK